MSNFEMAVDRLTDLLAETLKAKNADYGDSFGKLYAKYGDASTAIRLTDKLMRFETLIQNKQQVKGESINDTLLDIAGYAILTLVQKQNGGRKND